VRIVREREILHASFVLVITKKHETQVLFFTVKVKLSLIKKTKILYLLQK